MFVYVMPKGKKKKQCCFFTIENSSLSGIRLLRSIVVGFFFNKKDPAVSLH